MSIASQLTALQTNLTNAYTAISNKGGTVPSSKTMANLPTAINSISTGSSGITPSGNIQLTKSTSTDVTNYATATVRSASVSLNTPTINSSTGVVTSSATVSTTGWINSAPSSKTLSLSIQGAQTITPSTSNKTIASGKYLTGTQTIAGDANLVSGNIKSGVSIFGVTGSYTASGGGDGGSNIGTATVVPSGTSTSMTFTGLLGEPTWFFCHLMDTVTLGSTAYCTFIGFDGTNLFGTYSSRSGSWSYTYKMNHSNSYYTKTYSNGSLTLSSTSASNGGNMYKGSNGYQLIYGY